MKKIIILVILVLLISTSCSDNCINGDNNYVTLEKNLDNFENIKNPYPGTVRLKRGESKVDYSIEENLKNKIEFDINNNTLKLKDKDDNCFSSNGIDFIFYSNSYNRLENNGSADWTSDSLNFDPVITSNGSGDITLTGLSESQEIKSNGSGEIDLTSMPTMNAVIESNGSGDIFLNVSNNANVLSNGSAEITLNNIIGKLEVEINGSGDVIYTGTPSEINVKENGSGRLVKK